MTTFLEILKYTVPSLVLFATIWLFLRTWSRQEDKRRNHEFNMHMKEDILPVRLQAYERIILFMERMAPESILMRLNRKGMTAGQLQAELQNSIRHEYEHNLSQQTYISEEAWQKVQTARNQVVKIINESAAELNEGASGASLGKLVLEKVMELKTPPSQAAVDFLKREVHELFLS